MEYSKRLLISDYKSFSFVSQIWLGDCALVGRSGSV